MGVRETSLAAFRSLDLQESESELLALIRRHFPNTKFTRKELSRATRWEINRVCGRVNSLVAKGQLTEYPETRDGGHLLSLSTGEIARPNYRPIPVTPGDNVGDSRAQAGAKVAHPVNEKLVHCHGRNAKGQDIEFSYVSVVEGEVT